NAWPRDGQPVTASLRRLSITVAMRDALPYGYWPPSTISPSSVPSPSVPSSADSRSLLNSTLRGNVGWRQRGPARGLGAAPGTPPDRSRTPVSAVAVAACAAVALRRGRLGKAITAGTPRDSHSGRKRLEPITVVLFGQ